MNRTKIKNYAPQARRDFVQAITDRAAFYGLTGTKIEPVTAKGDMAITGGRAFPRGMVSKRTVLEQRIKRQGFEQTMEALAYTWFNRLVAIRYMELHGYLDHGYRVLSHPEGKAIPEILEHAEHVDLPDLDRVEVIELKLDGAKEVELYRMLLLAQCNALHSGMPFLFERIDDETELVLPDNLLHSDSIIRKLVNEIDEEDWQEVEVMGWLYESYISERYAEVIGKVVESQDIPAATQRFTPKWVVRYLVQNTLGRQWLATYPDSQVRQQMKYFIEPAEQTPEVQVQLKAITPESLSPEEITLLDPACGSGHILVEAYDLFKSIYQERGYRAKDIPRLILEKNLFGLEIDDRAAQLGALALMMKARADDRHILAQGIQPHVLAIQESNGINPKDVAAALNLAVGKEPLPPSSEFEFMDEIPNPLFIRSQQSASGDIAEEDVAQLVGLFEDASTFGSLIQVSSRLAEKLPTMAQAAATAVTQGDLITQGVGKQVLPLIAQAHLLARQFDAVVANPPYMGGKYFTDRLKKFVARNFQAAKADLYACFIQRNAIFAKQNGFIGMITIPNWMFLSSFEEVRKSLFDHQTIDTFIHNGRGVFGSDFGSCSFVYRNVSLPAYRGTFRRLFDKQGSVASNDELEQRFGTAKDYVPSNVDFTTIPEQRLAYWISDHTRHLFSTCKTIGDFSEPQVGLQTSDNPRFIRRWTEVAISRIGLNCRNNSEAISSHRKWFPLDKGGEFRRWFGNNEYIVNWEENGKEIKEYVAKRYSYLNGNTDYVVKDRGYFFRQGVTWNKVSISLFAARVSFEGAIFTDAGMKLLCNDRTELYSFAAFLNSTVASYILSMFSATVNFEKGAIASLPFIGTDVVRTQLAEKCTELARTDWNSFETSWDFQTLPVLQHKAATLYQSQEAADAECLARFLRMKKLEEENNRFFIDAYGLQDELSAEVPDDQITLYRPNREEDIQRLISYATGCMMGRYSLDGPGLIYANSGNENFDPTQYKTFAADRDGIIPIMDGDWFPDAAANRLVEFVSVAWPEEHLEENLRFIAGSLGPNRVEQPRDTIGRYLSTGFYKHHLSMYKRRPIYWLFSSGKLRAFQCLVYLSRYHEGTLSRMRTEYVIPLQGKLTSRIEQLASDIQQANSTSHRRKLEKERDSLLKQKAELLAFDEKLRHYADRRIILDLDDGVKVNYGKFGDLLAEVKAVCGSNDGD